MDLAQLRIRVGRTENLPVLPQVVGAVLRLVSSSPTSSEELTRALESDPAIAAKLLRVANTPFYSRGLRATTVNRAIAVLGSTCIKSLVLGLAYSQLSDEGPRSREFDRCQFWKHSMACAIAARAIGEQVASEQIEELYLAGMLHDIGLLVLSRFHSVELDNAIGRARRSGVPLHEVERSLYGWDHGDVGGILAERWGLEPMTHDAVKFHHRPADSPGSLETTTIVCLANQAAYRSGYPAGTCSVEPSYDAETMASVGLSLGHLEQVEAQTKERTAGVLRAFLV